MKIHTVFFYNVPHTGLVKSIIIFYFIDGFFIINLILYLITDLIHRTYKILIVLTK